MDFRPVFMFVYITGSIMGGLCIMLWAALDPAMRIIPFPIVLDTVGHYIVFFSPAYAALCALVMSRYFCYVVDANGICGQNLLGASRMAEWDSITKITPVKLGNLTFAKLVTNDGKLPVWLPLFVHDEEALGGTILNFAPEDNVTRQLVRTIHLAA